MFSFISGGVEKGNGIKNGVTSQSQHQVRYMHILGLIHLDLLILVVEL